jgi:heme exporter protein CcmD
MTEALETLIASKHWPYIWPCYLLAALTFAGLSWRAVVRLRSWKARAEREERSGA